MRGHRVRKMVQTYRVYKFIETVDTNKYSTTWRTQKQVLAMVGNAYEGTRPTPPVWFGAAEFSWYDSENHQIHIANHQRDYATVLHEVVHAEGYWDHGPRFMRRYIEKLVRFARCDEGYLIMTAQLYGIEL